MPAPLQLPIKKHAKPAADSSWSSSVYFEPGTKYIWDLALDKAGDLYVATGDRGEIFRVTTKGDHSVFFKSDETHIRVLAFDAQQNLIAGSDGSGLIYRISPAGEGFVLYSAPKKEITALAIDRGGNIYAAAVGEKKGGTGSSSSLSTSLLNVPSTSMGSSVPSVPGMTITPGPTSPITSGPFPFPGGSISGGSDIYRIAPTVLPPSCGPRATTSCTLSPSIRATDCWPALATEATSLLSLGSMISPTCSRPRLLR